MRHRVISKQYIFKQKLAGKPIGFHMDEVTHVEVNLLIECGVLVIDREQHGKNVAIVAYPISIAEGNPVYRKMLRKVGEFVRYR
jgi:ribosomal protein L30/L7E